jgi:threonylcarbamoyladenosine tRNA methylthiotransferase MtaB
MNAYFYTLGCKVNQYETQAMREDLEQHGYQTHEFAVGQADVGKAVIVVNSCTVTGESDRKLRQLLRRCRREHPSAVLVLTGCMPQAFPEKAYALEEADIVLGNADRCRLPEYLREFKDTHRRIKAVAPHEAKFDTPVIHAFDGRTRAFVKIEDGCNRFCSYCIIPYARGRVRSKPLGVLQQEVHFLAEKGYREVVLVGINLTAYGQDCGLSIADAVEEVCAVNGIYRVRLGSIEPDHLTDEVIARLAACDKLCPHFHVALQSGCDTTLKRMNRHYTTAEFRAVCEKLRAAFPKASLTTDIMVGFPGETEEEFEKSLAFAESIKFSRLHCFPYSRREGTLAAKAEGQVTQAEKDRRNRRMIAMGNRCRDAYAEALVGQTVEVLPETVCENGLREGYTDTYVPVLCDAEQEGVPVTVSIDRQKDGVCYGTVIQA